MGNAAARPAFAGHNGIRYHSAMIRDFRDSQTQRLFRREFVRALPSDVQRTALRKLAQLDAAVALNDLRLPPGNHLEALQGDRNGQHSIRVNDQWRLCFVWRDDGAQSVELVDYH